MYPDNQGYDHHDNVIQNYMLGQTLYLTRLNGGQRVRPLVGKDLVTLPNFSQREPHTGCVTLESL